LVVGAHFSKHGRNAAISVDVSVSTAGTSQQHSQLESTSSI